MSLTICQYDQIPTIGAILGSQGHKDALDNINRKYGSSSFFGSSDDPCASHFSYFVERVVEPIRIIASKFREQFKELMEPEVNQFKPIVSLKDMEQGIPECMWLPIAMHPTIRKLGEQRRVDLFGYDTEYLPKENVYDRLIHNGEAWLTPATVTNDTYEITIENWSTDPVITEEELEAIEDTYNFIDRFYGDLDTMFDSIGKKSYLKKKSYLNEDMMIRDLDFTSFPNKKG